LESMHPKRDKNPLRKMDDDALKVVLIMLIFLPNSRCLFIPHMWGPT
jgi:hypothetical protein